MTQEALAVAQVVYDRCLEVYQQSIKALNEAQDAKRQVYEALDQAADELYRVNSAWRRWSRSAGERGGGHADQ